MSSNRFSLNKTLSFFLFPPGNYESIKILDFELVIPPSAEQELHLQIVRMRGNTSIVDKEDTMNFEAFKKRFYSEKRMDRDIIMMNTREQVTLYVGAKDEKGIFIPLTRLKHTDNIDDFRIDIGYELYHPKTTILWDIM